MNPNTLLVHPGGDFQLKGCRWNADSLGRPVYLVGDSNAAQYSEAVLGAAEDLGRPLTISAAAGCPFLAVKRSLGATYAPADQLCAEYVSSTIASLRRQEAGTVVIANTDVYFWQTNYQVGSELVPSSSDMATKFRAYEDGLRRIVRAVEDSGHDVILVQPIPRFDVAPFDWDPHLCSSGEVLRDRCRASMSIAFADSFQEPGRQVVNAVARDTGARVIDPREEICIEAVCATYVDGRYIYKDTAHITVDQSRRLTPEFTEVLRPGK